MSQVTPDQLKALIGLASKRLGMSPEQLQKTVQEGGLAGLSDSIGAENAKKLQAMVGNPQQAEQLLNSPQIQQVISKLLGG